MKRKKKKGKEMRFFLTRILIVAFLATPLFWIKSASAQDVQSVMWGGLAYASAGKDSTSPVAEILRQCTSNGNHLCEKGNLEETAKKYFVSANYENIELSVGTIGVRQITSYLLSPVITTEIVLEADQGSVGYSYTYIISGNVLIYEIDDRKDINYVYSLPVTLLQDEFYKSKISIEDQQNYIADMYLNENRDAGNLFDVMTTLASKRIYVPIEIPKSIQITQVKFSGEVEEILESTNTVSGWKESIANFASARLAEWSEVPIVPSSLGLNKLQYVFSNGLTKINLPEHLSYEFEIDTKRFVKQEPENGVVCFMVGTVLSVQSFDETILSSPFFHTQDGCVDIPKNSTRDPAVFFPINLLSQLDKIFKVFDCRDFSDYIHKSVTENPQDVVKKVEQICSVAFKKG